MQADTVFDLASVTKLFTVTALLSMVDSGEVWLDMPVRAAIPEFRHQSVRLRHLVTHTSGLPGWRPLYLRARGREAVLAAICEEELEREPGSEVEYSDLGLILVGEVVARTAGAPLEEAVSARIFAPLGMTATGYRLSGIPVDRFAATESGNRTEYGMCGNRAASFDRWRSGVIRGEANDGNCFYALDGVAGHAGLFSTAPDLTLFARTWLGGGRPLLSAAVRLAACRTHVPGANPWAWGWMKPGAGFGAFMGDLAGPEAVGHTGFTGTSVLLDPSRDLFAILLTNRQHVEHDDAAKIAGVRRSFYNAVYASLLP